MIGKPRGKSKTYPVYVYDPAAKRKIYVGSCPTLGKRSGDPVLEAKALEALKESEFQRRGYGRRAGTWRDYSERWLDVKHGPGTRRPGKDTKRHNDESLTPFLTTYGDRRMGDRIPRDEALDWAAKHRWQVRAVSAMFNDAMDEGLLSENPFANRKEPQARGRKDISPITEDELERLGEIALERWGRGEYGPMCRAWIMMAGWVGCRPGEMWQLRVEDLDLSEGWVRFCRIKGHRQEEWVVLPGPAIDALNDMGVPLHGLVFSTQTGKPMSAHSALYYWDPIRTTFADGLTVRRRRELLHDRANLDLYELRHFCASLLADRGASAIEIAQQLGNSLRVCEETYIHGHRDRIHGRNRARFGQQTPRLRSVGGEQTGQQIG